MSAKYGVDLSSIDLDKFKEMMLPLAESGSSLEVLLNNGVEPLQSAGIAHLQDLAFHLNDEQRQLALSDKTGLAQVGLDALRDELSGFEAEPYPLKAIPGMPRNHVGT